MTELKETKKQLIAEIESKKIHHKTKTKAIKAINSFGPKIIHAGGCGRLSCSFTWKDLSKTTSSDNASTTVATTTTRTTIKIRR